MKIKLKVTSIGDCYGDTYPDKSQKMINKKQTSKEVASLAAYYLLHSKNRGILSVMGSALSQTTESPKKIRLRIKK